MKCEMVTHYESPELQEFANKFATWLTRKVNGRLPAPHLRLVGASEELWPSLYETARLTGSDKGFDNWCQKSDACAFEFFALPLDGEMKRIDPQTKSQILPLLFPYYENEFIDTLLDYDAVIFLRLSRLPNPHRQVTETVNETAYVISTWVKKPLAPQDSDGNIEEEQIVSWLNEYEAEREQQ